MAKRPKLKIDQIPKIRPFFQSARCADSKNAKKFGKSWFFKDFFQRKPIRSHATSLHEDSHKNETLLGYHPTFSVHSWPQGKILLINYIPSGSWTSQ